MVQPSQFVLEPGAQTWLEVVVSMTDSEFSAEQARTGIGAALCLDYVDQVESAKPHK